MKKDRKVIALDLDSVLNDGSNGFICDWVDIYNKRFNDNLDYKSINKWDIASFFTRCTKRQCFDILTPEFFFTRTPTKDAKFLIDTLKEMGHQVKIVTAFRRHTCEAKVDWIEKYLGLSEKDTIFCNDKYSIDCWVHLDDGEHNFLLPNGLPKSGVEKILYTQSHNVNASKLGLHYRVSNLLEVIPIVARLDKHSKK